ncbi:unnamed protein product [Withania somnifera]
MGRNKLVMEKIEDSTSRQLTYSKRKDSIVKKAKELAILCDTDVALLTFSPTGHVNSYSSRGSVEDVMLRAVNRSSNLNRQEVLEVSSDLNMSFLSLQQLTQSLTQSKYEVEMMEKIAMYYEPEVENINSVQEADACYQFLMSAMEQIQQSKARLLNVKEFLQRNENVTEAVGDEICEETDQIAMDQALASGVEHLQQELYYTSLCVKNFRQAKV